jgi:predicted secreted protein
MSGAIPGPGFLLSKGDGGSPENFTTVTEVKDIKGPQLKLDTVDVTNQSSPGGYEEIVATIRRSGEVTFDVQFQPADATHDAVTGVIADLNNRVLRNWRLNFPNQARKWSFAAYVTGFEETAPVAGILTASLTLKISGQPGLA